MIADHIRPSAALDQAIHARFVAPLSATTHVPSYTLSIDAAVAFCRAQLPGWIWRLCTCSVTDDAWLMPDLADPEHGERLEKLYGHIIDPLSEGPGLDISTAPSGMPALALMICYLEVDTALREGRQPTLTTDAIEHLISMKDDLSKIELVGPPVA